MDSLVVSPPQRPPLLLRPMLWLARRITGKDPLPGRLLAWFPKGAVGVGVFEALAAGAPDDLDGRSLATARIVSSAVAGCPFCLDMNAATWKRAGLSDDELRSLVELRRADWSALGVRPRLAARYAEMTQAMIDGRITFEGGHRRLLGSTSLEAFLPPFLARVSGGH